MTNESEATWRLIGTRDSIPLREGRRVCFGDKEAAVFNLGDKFLAVESNCPHKQGPLEDGIVSGEAVFCPLHNWKIDLNSGDVIAGGEGHIATYAIKVEDDQLYIRF